VFWLLLCLVAGGPCAFLALEGVGIPYVAVALFALIWIGRRRHLLPETLLAFGLTYEIFRYGIADLISAMQTADYSTAAYFAAQDGVAIGFLGAAAILMRRQALGLRQRHMPADDRQPSTPIEDERR
jgi:hypothetical protein